ncbi:MAG: lactate racemase domain-containing protein [Pirellulales bacterium]
MTRVDRDEPTSVLTLRYGADSSLPLELPTASLVAYCDAPRGEALTDVAAAADRMLAEPLGYPPLAQACVPGDRVVLALAADVPQAATLVARTVAVMTNAGVAPADITLLRASHTNTNGHDPWAELCAELQIVSAIHDPQDRNQLGYLAASATGDPIYVNRALHEADLVLSIDCLRLEESLGYLGINSAIFPTFCDADNLKRYRLPKSSAPADQARLRQAAEEAGRLLGVQFTIQVVPGRGNDVLHVLAGELRTVLQEGQHRCEAAWEFAVPKRAALVVTTIEGRAEQTWDNLARALASAAHAVQEEGAIAVCTELSGELGPALKRMLGCDNPEAAVRNLGRQPLQDSPAAAELLRALARGKVYLLSSLDHELVEDLGLLPLEAGQLSRLAARYGSCIVLTNAQHAVAHASSDSAPPRATSRPSRRS